MSADVAPARPKRLQRLAVWAQRIGLARRSAIALTVAAIASGVATYIALTGSPPLGPNPSTILVLIILDLVLLLPLGALVAHRIVRLWAERRRGLAGSRLHARLVLLFSALAVTPAIIVAVFSLLFFNFGIQSWFSDRVRTALYESLSVTDKYLAEHQQAIRSDILGLARDINREALFLTQSPALFRRFVLARAQGRAISGVFVFDSNGRILVDSGLTFSLQLEKREELGKAILRAKDGKLVILASADNERVRAIQKLDVFFNADLYLYVSRSIDPSVVKHVARTQEAVAEYKRLEGSRSGLQISFFMLFGGVALLLLLASVWAGLMFANHLAEPISALIAAAERVRSGDLRVRVSEGGSDDEMSSLSRSFNRMTSRLERNRKELLKANQQLEARREFTETVLAGVSAGVIGLDAKGQINLPNRSASQLLATDLHKRLGKPLVKVVPEMAEMFQRVREQPDQLQRGQLDIIRAGRALTLLVRIAAERIKGEILGYVVTFDDITELLSAQRKAAWADVARRIAHEIKNPLTPIQLSAERLRRRYLSEIHSDIEGFETCTDTIVRQVGDIGRLVDEFSEFARMPAPVLSEDDLADICRRAVFLQRNAHPGLEIDMTMPKSPLKAFCDGAQIGQALTNILKNAAESLLDPATGSARQSGPAKITVRLARRKGQAVIEVNDNGLGFPPEDLHRLTEPYVTIRTKGTGLGLAIVKKIMEDHGGSLVLENRKGGGARVQLIFGQQPGAFADRGPLVASDAAAE